FSRSTFIFGSFQPATITELVVRFDTVCSNFFISLFCISCLLKFSTIGPLKLILSLLISINEEMIIKHIGTYIKRLLIVNPINTITNGTIGMRYSVSCGRYRNKAVYIRIGSIIIIHKTDSV